MTAPPYGILTGWGWWVPRLDADHDYGVTGEIEQSDPEQWDTDDLEADR